MCFFPLKNRNVPIFLGSETQKSGQGMGMGGGGQGGGGGE